MKLTASNTTGWMDITRISIDGSNIMTIGVIAGSVPIRAVPTPLAFLMTSLTMLAAISIALTR